MADLNQRLQVLLSDEQMDFIKNLSGQTGRSIGELIRTAMDKTYRPSISIEWKRILTRISEEDFTLSTREETGKKGDRSDGRV